MKTENPIAAIQPLQEPTQTPSVSVATISGMANGYPLVDWQHNPSEQPIQALSQVKIEAQHIGQTCTLALLEGDPSQPIVMGLLYNPEAEDEHWGDEQPVVIRSADSISLQAGKAKIQLFADGRIHLQGVSINSQAYGPNKIKGTAVKIN